jgi:GNAT superfamily N-acetyltransferase
VSPPEPELPVPRAGPLRPEDWEQPLGGLGPKVLQAGPNGTLRWEDEELTEYELGPWNAEVFHLEGIPRANELPASLRQDWSCRLGLSPREFFLALFDTDKVRPGETTLSVERDEAGIYGVDLEIDLDCPRTGRSMGRMDRTFSFPSDGPARAHHSLLDLEPEAQGMGVAKDLLANAIALYDRAGIQQVELTAALSVGGYAWAKYGFMPRSEREARALYNKVRERLQRLEEVPPTARKIVMALTERDDPKSIWALSDLDGVTVQQGSRQLPLGKALLLGTVWQGVLRLDDPEARSRFDQYVSKTPAQGEEGGHR